MHVGQHQFYRHTRQSQSQDIKFLSLESLLTMNVRTEVRYANAFRFAAVEKKKHFSRLQTGAERKVDHYVRFVSVGTVSLYPQLSSNIFAGFLSVG
jgi:hypothetical protein